MKTLYERLRYRLRMVRLGWTIEPIRGGAPEGGEGGEGGTAPAAGEGEDGREGGEAAGESRKPPWGSDEEFDADKAWKLIENLRGDNDSLKGERDELRGKVKDHEDASKSDQEKLQERATGAETDAKQAKADAARLRVALRKGLTETQAKRLVGETEEELEQDADDLLESFRDAEGEQGSTPRRPRERLRPGAAPGADPEPNDPAELAKSVSRDW